MASRRARLSERRGLIPPEDALFEGVPEHLNYLLHQWTVTQLGAVSVDSMAAIAAFLRLRLNPNYHNVGQQLMELALADEDVYLELVDQLLSIRGPAFDGLGTPTSNGSRLKGILTISGSVWTVSDDNRMLEERVGAAAKAAFTQATAPNDAVTEELKFAWAKAYGRNPDPSDAWDHAIKAVEELLAPIIIPADTTPTLGKTLAAMEAKTSKWTLGMDDGGTKDDIQALAKLLRLMWSNPDRHGGSAKRTPRQDEAERVVGIAVLVVNLCRGHLVSTAP